MNLIGLAGLKGAGKDTAAKALHGYSVAKFAGGIKTMLNALMIYQGCPAGLAYEYLEGKLKEEPCPYLGGRTPRHAMQALGQLFGREAMGPDFWLSVEENSLEDALATDVVFTDVRHQNEVDFIRARGGRTFRIERGLTNSDKHQSETSVATLKVDGEIANTGTIADLHAATLRAVGQPE